VTQLYAAPWAAQFAGADEHDISSGDPREWGVDVPLPAGSPVYAPFAGTVAAYQASPTDWGPGRLIETGGPAGAEAVGFGHVVPTVPVGARVTPGEEIGYVPSYAEGGPHTEFMLFPTGQYGSRTGAVDPRGFIKGLFSGGAGLPAGGAGTSGAGDTQGPSLVQTFLAGIPGVGQVIGGGTDPLSGLATNIAGGVAGAVAAGAAGAFASVFTVAGHGIVGFLSGLTTNVGVWAQRQAVALAVAVVVLLVLFLPSTSQGSGA
jgi:hypothetical protein